MKVLAETTKWLFEIDSIVRAFKQRNEKILKTYKQKVEGILK